MSRRRTSVRSATGLLLGAVLWLWAAAPAAASADGHRLGPTPGASADARLPAVAFLVRHGEAEPTGERDRPLTAAGEQRAELLAELLEGEGLERILSSDYPRTRQTAAPLAARLGLEVELYEAHDLEGLAARLLAAPARVLVVGHSNTTGELAALLGGDSGVPIAAQEHDRLYVVDLATGATEIRRYGDPAQGAAAGASPAAAGLPSRQAAPRAQASSPACPSPRAPTSGSASPTPCRQASGGRPRSTPLAAVMPPWPEKQLPRPRAQPAVTKALYEKGWASSLERDQLAPEVLGLRFDRRSTSHRPRDSSFSSPGASARSR